MTPTMPKMIDRPSAISTYRAPSTSPFSRNSVRTAAVIERRLRHRLQLALALGLRNRDRVQRLPLAGHLADDLEDVPLVLPLRLVLRADHVHRLQQLVIPRAERERASLEPVRRARQTDGLKGRPRSEEHTSELQSQSNLVCRLLLEKKNNITEGTQPRDKTGASRRTA